MNNRNAATPHVPAWGSYYVYNSEVILQIERLKVAPSREKLWIREQLVKKLSYLVCSKIKKHHSKVFYEDLLQEGKLGLVKAIDDFDPQRGLNFFKFANWHIKNRIRRYFKWNYKLPTTTCEASDICEKEGNDTQHLFEDREGKRLLREVVNKLPDKDRRVIIMRFGLDGGKEHTFEQIGEMFSLSKQRIEQIKTRAIAKLSKNRRIREFFQGA
jgi:RNA polymerase sigma factor (sigma-70 family)